MRGFPSVRKFSSFTVPSQGCRSHPDSFVFRFLFLLPYSIVWRLACLFGSLGSSASIQVFCRSCSICTWSFHVFGGSVVSPSYPSTILKVPSPQGFILNVLDRNFLNSRSASSCCRLVLCLSTPSRHSWAFSEPSVQSKQKIKFSKFISEHVPCVWLSKCLHIYGCFWVS